MSWPDDIADFDRDLWHRLIACTGRGRHSLEVVGLLFESSDCMKWSPMPGRLFFTRLDENDTADVRARGIEGSARFGRGSMNAFCPNGCELRIPRDRWDDLLGETRRVGPEWLDLSLYA